MVIISCIIRNYCSYYIYIIIYTIPGKILLRDAAAVSAFGLPPFKQS